MGLFDFLKKKKTDNESAEKQIPEEKSPEKCSECMCTIEGRPWKLGEKYYCKACYNRRMANGLRGFTYQRLDFEMPIDNVFLIKNHGVAVTGTIRKGCVYRGDTVIVNDREYTVRQIDLIPNEVDSAKEGMNVGLHLSTMDAGLFKRGDLITMKPLQENQKNTFICDVCGKERPVKYRHKGNTCADCAEKGTARKTDEFSGNQADKNHGVVNKKESVQVPVLDAVIQQYRVGCDFTVEQQREWLAVLNKTIPTIMVGEDRLGVDYFLEPRMLAEAGNMLNTVGRIAFTVGKWLSITVLTKALVTDSVPDLVKTYCILTEYANMLIEPYNSAINDSKKYIYDVLAKTDLSQLKTAASPNKLYWAPAIYDGDPLILPAPDYEIHVFPMAAQMIMSGESVRCDGGIPEGYGLAQKGSGRFMRLRTIRNQNTGVEMIPLFTDLNLMLQIFTPRIRVSIVDYQSARRFCLKDRNICSGIIINPGKDNNIISVEELMNNN